MYEVVEKVAGKWCLMHGLKMPLAADSLFRVMIAVFYITSDIYIPVEGKLHCSTLRRSITLIAITLIAF